MASAHSPLPTACSAALQDRSARTKKAIAKQPGLIDHPVVQGFGISIASEPHKVSGCLPCKASAKTGCGMELTARADVLKVLGQAQWQMTAA